MYFFRDLALTFDEVQAFYDFIISTPGVTTYRACMIRPEKLVLKKRLVKAIMHAQLSVHFRISRSSPKGENGDMTRVT